MRRTLKGKKVNLSAKRRLRREMTSPEIKLWSYLRSKQFASLKFRRQHGIGPYIVDFFCPGARMVVEVDGDTHSGDAQRGRDEARENYLKGLGLRIVRYNNRDVVANIEGVLADLMRKLPADLPPPAPPYKGGERGSGHSPLLCKAPRSWSGQERVGGVEVGGKGLIRQVGLVAIAVLLSASLVHAARVDEDPTEAKVREIAKELRCAVCQNESVYDSRSDLAVQMKELIRDRLKAGESPESIRRYFVSRYGDYILLEPRRQGLNWIIWVGPTAAFLAASGVLFVYLRRRVRRDRPSAGAPVDPKLKKRLQQEIDKLPDEDVP